MKISDQIQVIYVCPHVDGYGADRSLLNCVLALRPLGVSPLFIIPRKGLLAEHLELNDIPYLVTGYKTWTKGRSANPLVCGIKAVAKLLLNKWKAYHIAKKLKQPVISMVHTNDLVTNFGVELSKQLEVKHIQHSRCLLHESAIYFDFGERRSLHHLSHHSSAVIFNSNTVHDHYRPYCNGVEAQVIHSAIFSKKDIKPPVKKHNKAEALRFIFMGRYEDQKDPRTIIKAVKILVDKGFAGFQVSVYGKLGSDFSKYFADLMNYVSMNHLEQFVSLNDFDSTVSNRLQHFDVGLFTSPMEGIARVIIEYMMNGLPVIGSNTGGASLLIKDQQNGLHFTPGNAIELAEKMEMLLTNRKLVAELGKQAFESVDDKFSNEYTASALLKVYKNVLSK